MHFLCSGTHLIWKFISSESFLSSTPTPVWYKGAFSAARHSQCLDPGSNDRIATFLMTRGPFWWQPKGRWTPCSCGGVAFKGGAPLTLCLCTAPVDAERLRLHRGVSGPNISCKSQSNLAKMFWWLVYFWFLVSVSGFFLFWLNESSRTLVSGLTRTFFKKFWDLSITVPLRLLWGGNYQYGYTYSRFWVLKSLGVIQFACSVDWNVDILHEFKWRCQKFLDMFKRSIHPGR